MKCTVEDKSESEGGVSMIPGEDINKLMARKGILVRDNDFVVLPPLTGNEEFVIGTAPINP